MMKDEGRWKRGREREEPRNQRPECRYETSEVRKQREDGRHEADD